jgi:hypothetical protein
MSHSNTRRSQSTCLIAAPVSALSAVHQQPERFDLRVRPLVAEDHGNAGSVAVRPRFQLARGFPAKVAIDHGSVAARQRRHFEAELAEAAAHAIHCGLVLPRIAGIEDQAVDGPGLNLQCLWRAHLSNTSPHALERESCVSCWRSFGGCALRSPDELKLSIQSYTEMFKASLFSAFGVSVRVVRLRVSTKRVLTP